MPLQAILDHWIQKIDYGFLLPVISRLPVILGDPLSRLRGFLTALLDYDWRSKALNQRFVRQKTYEAVTILRPESTRIKRLLLTCSRFIYNSKEEWQALLFANNKAMNKISDLSQIEEFNILYENQKKGRGQILISSHFDSFCLGMVLLGMRGLRVSGISTAAIEDVRVHPSVRSFFNRKYRGMEALMHGKVLYYETSLKYFYRALEEGQIVVIIGDIPGEKHDTAIDFLSRRFKLPIGAWKMARRTESLVGGFICFQTGVGRYRFSCYPPSEIDPESPIRTLQPVYSFLEGWIRAMPQRWIAADLLAGEGYLKYDQILSDSKA